MVRTQSTYSARERYFYHDESRRQLLLLQLPAQIVQAGDLLCLQHVGGVLLQLLVGGLASVGCGHPCSRPFGHAL